ncbi:hypothetical protein WM45_07160 [Citrobacter sp. AATXR]|uniref:Uncharacterized protein n=1 Tax=Citrobacter freundii TaxID=546 RepID=A0AA44SKZ4_CITFR|nr:hypothetical protein CfB38_0279 [Citrobacter freundii]KYC21999.1 hypothetical protein WM45_07160 [Citrobacter sp. AATXR]OYQ97806.1 hypothetical protein B9P90_09520 [Citrobacter freundii]OYR05018.1 hypothetical protein B9P89_10210 [Citrobacter freundii]
MAFQRTVPFTLCSLLLWSFFIGERVKGLRSPLNNPGSPAGKLLLRNTLRLFLQATGPGARKRPCKTRPEPASMLAPPALRKRVGNFQPDQPTPDHLSFYLNRFGQQNKFNWKSER